MSVKFVMTGASAEVQNPELGNTTGIDTRQQIQPRADGGYYRYGLCADAARDLDLRWSDLRRSEMEDLRDFFQIHAVGTLNEFTYTDERGDAWTAHFLSTRFDARPVADDVAASSTFSTGGRTVPTTTRSGGVYELDLKLHLSARAGTPMPTPTPEPT